MRSLYTMKITFDGILYSKKTGTKTNVVRRVKRNRCIKHENCTGKDRGSRDIEAKSSEKVDKCVYGVTRDDYIVSCMEASSITDARVEGGRYVTFHNTREEVLALTGYIITVNDKEYKVEEVLRGWMSDKLYIRAKKGNKNYEFIIHKF